MQSLWSTKVERTLGFASVLVILVAVLTLSPTVTRATKDALGYSSWPGKFNEILNPFRTRHALLQSGLPTYDLKIPAREYREILAVVNAAQARGELTEDLKQWSRAEFILEGRSRAVQLRVRGDFADHWTGPRKSWRIRFPKDDPLDGQREINLIVPSDGKAITQSFANEVFRGLGCLTLRDAYVVLRINGVPQGVYYACEHFEAPLLARRGRTESTIFRNPSGGLSTGSFREMVTSDAGPAWVALSSLLDMENDPTAEHFRDAAAVTEMEDYLRYLAGVTLFSADHTSEVTDNHRLYYDASLGVFQRIPWDLEPQRIPKIERFDLADWYATFDVFARWPMSQFQRAALSDDGLRLRRNRILWELVRDDGLLKRFEDLYAGIEFAFWSDSMGKGDEEHRIDRFRELVRHNMRVIRRALCGNKTSLHITPRDEDTLELEWIVDNASGIHVDGIELEGPPDATYRLYRDTNGMGEHQGANPFVAGSRWGPDRTTFLEMNDDLFPEFSATTDYPAYLYDPEGGGTPYRAKTLRTVLYPKTRRYRHVLRRERIGNPGSDSGWPTMRVRAVNAVTGEKLPEDELRIRIIGGEHTFDPADRVLTSAEFSTRHSNWTIREDSNGRSILSLGPGVERIDGNVVVPERVTLRIEPGTTLEMGAGASLVCFGPIRAEGTPDGPIHIRRAESRPWGVVAGVRGGEPSVFRHVHVSGGNTLEGITVQGIYFTGALAVHGGDAILENCRMDENSAEDGVNVKHGHVVVRNCVFENNQGDAIDLDWTTGEVSHNRFFGNLGDGLDLSGSKVVVQGNRIESSGDKGISVGEASTPRITENILVNNSIGIAIKDASDATIERCSLVGNRQALAAYCKKPIFGGARGVLRDCTLLDSRESIQVDAISELTFEGCVGQADARFPGLRPAVAEEILSWRRTALDNDVESTGR